MIEMRRLKNVVIFIQTILSFVLSRKIIIIFASNKFQNAHIFQHNGFINVDKICLGTFLSKK